MAAASAASLLRIPSTHTEVAEADDEGVTGDLPTFSLSGPIVRLTDDEGTRYLFLRLVVEEDGDTYTLPFYQSSGLRSRFAGHWFPCVEVEEGGHIVKGTPLSVPRFLEGDALKKDESFLERVPSRLGLLGMAALNTMSEEEFAVFRDRLLRESRALGAGARDVEDVLDLAEPLFLAERSDLKTAIAEETVRDATSREALNRFLAGEVNHVGGGRRGKRRRMTKRRRRQQKKK